MKRILVTGGAGFLGSHLCDRLVRDGNEVLCLDNLSTGTKANLQPLPRRGFDWCWWDVSDRMDRFEFFDEIYNLACPASPKAYQADPIGTMMTCVLGAKNVLDLARDSKAKVLQASTSEVYGDPAAARQHETYWGNVNPIGPRACYDEGKRAAEALFSDHHRVYGTQIRVARIFNTYGPRMQPNDGRVIPTFIRQAAAGAPLTIHGNGRQTRSFCYVDDMVECLLRLMASDVTAPVNLGNPEEITVRDLACRIGGVLEFLPAAPDDPRQRCPDIARARRWLDWQPTISLDDGLRRTMLSDAGDQPNGEQCGAQVVGELRG